MKKLPLVLAFLALGLLPGAARSAACSPLNCAPSQFTAGHGTLLGFRVSVDKPVTVVDLQTGTTRFTLPAGIVGGDLLVHQEGRTLTWYDTTTGEQTSAVTLEHASRLAGVSQDGARAVGLQLTDDGSTTISIVTATGVRDIRVEGRQWDFDALRGDNLFLIKYLSSGGYQVRLLHVGTGTLDAKPLKDPHESGVIWGQPYSRLSSADGRYLFTLYVSSNGAAMVHALDLDAAKARCIDLPGSGDYLSATSYALVLSKNGRTLWALGPGYARVVGIDTRTRKVVKAFRLEFAYWNRGNGTRAALSPDGTRVALADGETVAVVDLTAKKLMRRDRQSVIALGYAPDGRLWKLR